MDEENLSDLEITLSNKIGEFLEQNGLKKSLVIVEHPDLEHPFIFWNCHFYDGAKLCADALRAFREQIVQEIN